MKKLYFFLVFMLLCTIGAFAQTPEKLSYQAIVRNASDKILANQAVGVQISILQNGSSVYTETHNATTNANGLINLEVGAGTQQSGAFGTINWGSDTYFIKTEIDVTGGTNYTISGTSQLVSVPYALHAKTAETFTGTLTETDPSFNASAAKNISASDITNWNQKEDKLPTGGTQGQVLGIDNGSYTWVTPATASDTQDLSLTGNEINLTDGGSVDISTATAVVANTAKVGITSEQADAIVTNTAKTGITSEQADAIVANTAKVGITSEQADAIVANTAKTGITSEQADAIVANTAKVGITSQQADAIVANTAKTGITSEQADAIVANTAKTGITSEQADAIVANTAKTGITSEQADAIVANTAKVGITSEQATAISDNTAALANKVDKDGAKGLSTNDFTTADKSKLDGIDAGAQVNVKPDWNAATGNVAEILNKPIIPAAADGSEIKVNGSTSITVSGTGTDADPYVITTTVNGAMVADMKISARTADHNGWLVCDGRLVSTTTYATLFGIVGYSYGGSGSTFKLPDLRGRVAGGIGQGSGLTNRVIGANVGAETHTLSTSEMPSHTHNVSDPGHYHLSMIARDNGDFSNESNQAPAGDSWTTGLKWGKETGSSYTGISINNTGSNSAHNNMQPTQFVGNYFIYAGQ